MSVGGEDFANPCVPCPGETFNADAGCRADIPPLRDRTPSPIRHNKKIGHGPAPYRNFDIDIGSVDVIYAEDEEIFRETAARELTKAGFVRKNIHECDNGLEALEALARLQLEGNLSMPLVVLLDIRMPGMDGRECALQVQELAKGKHLRREPFVICISSFHEKVLVDENGGNFQIVLPKPFTLDHINQCIESLKTWWTMGNCRPLPAWKKFAPTLIDLVVAGEEQISRMHAVAAFGKAGVLPDQIVEMDEQGEFTEEVLRAREVTSTKPLVVLVSEEQWATDLRQKLVESRGRASTKREPFVVCTSAVDKRKLAARAASVFEAFLPPMFGHAEVEWCLEVCRLWWLTRGEGPSQELEDDSESDPPSEED